MTANRTRIIDQLAADRFLASQASREQSEAAYVQNAIDRIAELELEGYAEDASRMRARLEAEGFELGALVEQLAETDQTIPPAADILALATERRETAERHDDRPGVRQLDRLRMSIASGARLHWVLGDLMVGSINNPGAVYAVSRAGCSCPNGLAGKAACWHCALYDLLIDMQEERAATADMEAERAETAATERATMGRRLCAARRQYQEVTN